MSRIAIVEKEKCNPVGCGNYLCARVCPINRKGEACIAEGDDNKAKIDEELCIGCGICPKRCPYEAISIINLPEDLTKDPIHRYGKNAFHLFDLPTPIFGQVVGIIGKNGIGKSTAIKVLAGVLKPNMGDFENEAEADYDKLIERFKGSEAQKFFEKIKSGDINISYKPQAVDLIPKAHKGKVRDLLKKADEKKQLNEIAKELEIDKILDSDIKNISGGELQRVAIAAAVLKKANLYFFDEPTSFLDIKQRIKISKFIRKLADENTGVMVIEHDMIILDYMADLVQIMYGKEGGYGIVSGVKSTREGINLYLSGFLPEENMRFRDHEIKFNLSPVHKEKKFPQLTSWTGIKKKLGKFNLSSQEGSINKHEVAGILGENGIGKTSFVKILAGVDKADEGNIATEIKVSYKPQYIDTTSDELVMNVLKDAIKNHNNDIIKPMGIKPLLLKKVSELSGGELQRVAIASALSQKADLYLMDEPSAYLDVEQRLMISKIIKDIMDQRGTAALIVDHDLLFLDYLSNKLMVFDGIPAEKGEARGPFSMEEGMTLFLTDIALTLRRDPESHRPRINKEGSVKDREQKSKNKYYYT